ncbi:hypothetical protein PUMCH_004021 [Australozyma saopauloensis]|uniref:Kri1-like C-terminal domain-containing protein n=1 Tax=Australozyma saopauloensis TaxID=291208 RepID=A0AAX4HEC8_9ASCO|nr:hypothetical protein PUMCH_004021 [[Candida] saopauloensis]
MARKKSAAKKAKEQAEKTKNVTEPVAETPVSKKVEIELAKDERAGSSDDSSSEDEDEYGELLTENVEELIQQVMSALKSDPKKLLDPAVKFFDETDVTLTKKNGDKPMYLKDYHRMNLLSGDYKNDDDENEYGTVDGEKPYAVAEREERNKLIDDIKNAFNDDDAEDEDDDGFLKKKESSKIESALAPKLPDPNTNSEEFLSSFINSQAWIPSKDDKVINLDAIDQEDEQDFDDAVENFEKAYNFRYEDPNSAEIVSYARTQATLRRGKTNSRKRARDKKNALKEQEKHEVEQALQKKKVTKMNKVMDRLAKIKEAVGDDVDDKVIERVFGDSLLNDDFDDADWDGKMSEIFNEQYYDSELVKPEWDEDDEIMAGFHLKKQQGAENDEEFDEEAMDVEEEAPEQGTEEPATKKSKKDKLKEKKSAKKEKESLKDKAKKIVEANTNKIQEEVEEERGRLKSDDVKFKYREVSPESYGLTTRDIFLADDQELNQYFSIKKFAPYRPKELAMKDKRKHTKKKQVQHWRYNTFRNVNGPERQPNEKEDEIWIPIDEEATKTVKKSKK